MNKPNIFRVDFSMCMFGEPYRKDITIITNCAELQVLCRPCCHVRHSVVLEGSRTKAAGQYPEALVKLWSETLIRLAPSGAKTVDGTFVDLVLAQLNDAARSLPAQAKAGDLANCSERQAYSSDRLPETDCYLKAAETQQPQFLELISFGQTSKAEAAAKAELRRKTRQRGGTCQGLASIAFA